MSESKNQQTIPRAVIHKQILDAASDRPEATVNALASEISGASPDLVERVLEQYGDPADEDAESVADEKSSSEANTYSDPAALSDKQRETIHAISEDPEATQRELGERLGVTSATINARLSNIDGFEWKSREEFVKQVLGGEPDLPPGGETSMALENSDESLAVQELDERVGALERQVAERGGSDVVFDDPQLVHKILRACFDSDKVSEEEELDIVQKFIQ